MENKGTVADLAPDEQESLLDAVHRIPIFTTMNDDVLRCLRQAELVQADSGDKVVEQGESARFFWILLDGSMSVNYTDASGVRSTLGTQQGRETFGEVPLLTGLPSRAECTIVKPSRLLKLNEDAFWLLMASCPTVRQGVLANMALRLEGMQTLMMQREKLASLGTMAAGLMHELNNPGAAARRATAQLRENLTRLQELSLRSCHMKLHAEELNCLAELQEYVLAPHATAAVSSLEQADAEEALAQWLEEAGIDDAWKLAPPLAGIGLTAEKLECARTSFRPESLSSALQWVEALVSSIQQLGTIEESIARVTELVLAVKRYSYADKLGGPRKVDVNESLQSSLVILGHKIRYREIQIDKQFSPNLPPLQASATGLNQVWTNLLDNAIDAAPNQGHIAIRTWTEGGDIWITISDDGPGISQENSARIFDPFFTTKPAGVGTGLGLNIAHKIITREYQGDITFASEPGKTVFRVRLPQQTADAPPRQEGAANG